MCDTYSGLYGHNPMQQADSNPLTNTLLLLPMLATVHLMSACSDSSDSLSPVHQQILPTLDNDQPDDVPMGTVAVSSEALFDFLYIATRFEFWNCLSYDNSMNTYIALDSKDDETDEGFNPLLLQGLLRESMLPGDPRASNENDRKRDAGLRTIPVSFAVTGADSISITLYAGSNFTPGVDDSMIYLSAVRTGPGRTFTAEDQLNNTRLTCTADNVGANIML